VENILEEGKDSIKTNSDQLKKLLTKPNKLNAIISAKKELKIERPKNEVYLPLNHRAPLNSILSIPEKFNTTSNKENS